jgi:hypothetical protein
MEFKDEINTNICTFNAFPINTAYKINYMVSFAGDSCSAGKKIYPFKGP